MYDILSARCGASNRLSIVPFVGTQVLLVPGVRLRSSNGKALPCFAHQFLIVDIRASHRHA